MMMMKMTRITHRCDTRFSSVWMKT